MRHGMVVLDAVAEQQLGTLLAGLPPRSDAPSRRLPAELGQELPRLVEHVSLLLHGHVCGVLMGVAVQPDLVAGVAHHGAFFRERLQGVSGDKPRCFDVVLVKQFQYAARPDGASPEAYT